MYQGLEQESVLKVRASRAYKNVRSISSWSRIMCLVNALDATKLYKEEMCLGKKRSIASI